MKVMERWVVEVGNGMEETYLQRHKEWEPIDKRLGFPGEKRIYRSLAGPVAYCLPNLASAPLLRASGTEHSVGRATKRPWRSIGQGAALVQLYDKQQDSP